MIAEIYDLLHQLGINSTYIGFFQTAHAVLLAIEQPERMTLVTKLLYPEVAKPYHSTIYCIERNIRTVAGIARERNPELLQKLAGYPLNGKLTASSFIDILARALLENERRA